MSIHTAHRPAAVRMRLRVLVAKFGGTRPLYGAKHRSTLTS
jgi:hypothetical protein